MKTPVAVLLMAYGGPDSLDEIEPYLLDVRDGRETPQELIEEIRDRYKAIGGKSPLLEITRHQAAALEKQLNLDSDYDYHVFIGMRHWRPYIYDVIHQIADSGITKMVSICMTPFDSKISMGAYYKKLQSAIESNGISPAWKNRLQLRKIGAWYYHRSYVDVLSNNLQQAFLNCESTDQKDPIVLFSTHSVPAFLAEEGDPYLYQFMHLCHLLASSANLEKGRWFMCFQSAGGKSIRWQEPFLKETIQWLSDKGENLALIAPIGFPTDNVEILYDIDIEISQFAQIGGISLARTPTLNDQPAFIKALSEIIRSENYTYEPRS